MIRLMMYVSPRTGLSGAAEKIWGLRSLLEIPPGNDQIEIGNRSGDKSEM